MGEKFIIHSPRLSFACSSSFKSGSQTDPRSHSKQQMASTKLTLNHPFLISLLPLAALALTTIIAFIHAIYSNYTTLASLWAPCTNPQLLGRPIPTPVCFAIHFFQAAHATPHARLEQAVIVSFLVGLATITAVEGPRIRGMDIVAGDEKKKKNKKKGPRRGDLISQAIIANLTIPWLLYSLAFGALAWQGIIIPAFLYRRRHQSQPSEADAGVTTHYSPTIPLSIILGLFLPAGTMLLHPAAALPIILFLLFPVWTTLAHHLLHPLTSRFTLPNKTLLYAPAIIASTVAHIAFILSLLTNLGSQDGDRPAAHAAALFLLELDHVAIFLTALYWIRLGSGAHGVLVTLAATIALGPGAGVCLGWLYPCEESTERRRRRKATGTFFGSLPA
ncbi:hypothetical protein N0V93_006336 [Gnomoniopsis smithogilvyi]|uniref:Uncharacterized protein n=1 Tax=Gnomoniopsis smithogilvyi TaxID=1191159 RepID=A0A9W8YRQ4_9PEZI|nr:hypothetical protein N0V93_006336 [Gnomoniopsis smithogilvyi]